MSATPSYDHNVIPGSPDIFQQRIAFDPSGNLDEFLKQVPAKWVVYLMADRAGQPVQLLCVKNLRASLKRRLGGEIESAAPSRRVDYREIVRQIAWRRVDSSFEADVVYLEAARRIFPATYRGMIGMRSAWFVYVNPDTTYPRYIRTIDPTGHSGIYFGPIEDKHSAQKLVHSMENLFDLCRDYTIFTQSPRGGACPWKQMGKCVGPCDGTVDLDAYRELIAHSAKVLADPYSAVGEHTRRMQQAAGELRFETAEKIKSYVKQLSQLSKGPFRYVRPLRDFVFVSLQRGPRVGTAKVFLVKVGHIEEIAALIDEPARPAEVLRHIFAVAHERGNDPLDDAGAERMGVVANHLFQARQRHGVFLHLPCIDEKSFVKAFRDLQNQKAQDESLGEGVTKELQAL